MLTQVRAWQPTGDTISGFSKEGPSSLIPKCIVSGSTDLFNLSPKHLILLRIPTIIEYTGNGN